MKTKGWEKWSRTCVLLVCGLLLSARGSMYAATVIPRNHAVEIRATVKSSPPEIQLNWVSDANATKYEISRKEYGAAAWTKIGETASGDNAFLDRTVVLGKRYEYQVIKRSSAGYTGYGYLMGGIELANPDDRGKLILVVEKRAATLEQELALFEQDLTGDGWKVSRLQVSETNNPPEVKALIKTLYAQDPANTRAVLLFGHVPVPYSGNITPDQHDDHMGAWPADVYYGEMDGTWTDTSVTAKGAARIQNWNVPGDGKFDQSEIPSKVELPVGRVDMHNLTCFANKVPTRSEVDLLRQYLDKNHRYRHGQFSIAERALLVDRRGLNTPEALTAFAWRNYGPLFGTNIHTPSDTQFLSNARSNTYLFSTLTAGGSFTSADGFGTSDEFALGSLNLVFSTFCGSYYGDWDNESNFLRAALGSSGSLLTSCYGGKPQWLFQPMATGATIGEALLLTQNNRDGGLYPPFNPGSGQIHIALLGDPTLRLHAVKPPQNFTGTISGNQMMLSWQPSAAANLRGYHIYKSESATGPFQKLTSQLITGTAFAAQNHQEGNFYQVRAFALSESPSGSYYNSSQALFFPDFLRRQTAEIPPAPPVNLGIDLVRVDSISIKWLIGSSGQDGFIVERKAPGSSSFVEIGRVGFDARNYTDRSLPSTGLFTYRVRAFNAAGISAPSNEATASNNTSQVEFLGQSAGPGANWASTYGAGGYHVFGAPAELPQELSLTTSYIHTFTYNNDKIDNRFLFTPTGTNRSATAWVVGTTGFIDLKFSDSKPRQLTFFFLDADKLGRKTAIEVYDQVNQTLLFTNIVSDYRGGIYVTYNVRHSARFGIRSLISNTNNTLFGMFLDTAYLPAPKISPEGGPFAGKTTVSITAGTIPTDIYYTVDGTEPTQASRKYTGPFELGISSVVQARAYRSGFPASAIVAQSYINTLVTRGGFIGWNNHLGGDWLGTYGNEGSMVRLGLTQLPSYASVILKGTQEWVWSENTSDPRGLYVDTRKSHRVAAVWYAPDEFTIDLGIVDVKSHALTLYFLDWDRAGRSQLVQVLDLNGNLLQELTVNDFQNGSYLTLYVQGFIRLKLKRLAGPNVVLSGLFFDPAPAELNQPIPLKMQNIQFVDNHFSTLITGDPGVKACLDSSTDGHTWTCLGTKFLMPGGTVFTTATTTSFGLYRCHTAP